MGRIRIGPSSWTDKSLLESGKFYPSGVDDAEGRLTYYASRFPDLVEVNSTYYALPCERNAFYWNERTPDDFVFDIKMYSLLTRHPTKPRSLPKDIYRELDEEARSKERIYLNHVPREAAEIVARFRTIPSCRILEVHGYAAFVRGVTRHWGGIRCVMRALGILDGKASDGDWKPGHWTETAFEEAIEAIVERYGTIPPKEWLALDGYPSTIDRLIRKHGGYQMMRHLYGVPEWEPVYAPWVRKGER